MGFFEGFLISLAVSMVVGVASALLRPASPTPSSPKPATLNDIDVPTAEDGRPVPVLFGTRWVEGINVLWYGDLATEPVKETSKGGGK